MIWGMSFDDSFEDEVKVTIIATWFNDQPKWPIHKKVITNTRWDPIRQRQPEDFVTRAVNNWSFTSNQNWGFTSTNVESDTPDPIPNNSFRTPDNSEEDWETPPFLTKNLNNSENN
jgi:hypothetical protein